MNHATNSKRIIPLSQSQTLHLADISAPTPTIESLAADRATIESLLDQGNRPAALAAWDRQRRAYATWSQLAFLRFQQDTEDQHAVAMRALADELGPVAIGHDSAIKRRLLADPDRAGLEAAMGAHIVRLWQADITTFDDKIAARLEEENRLAAAYTALTSSARLEIDGHIVNLSGLQPFSEHLDRATRYRAARVASAFYEENGAALDDIFDQMVRVRTAMARDLGYPHFTELGYQRMRRTDYDAADVARYRDQILAQVVPLLARLLEARRADQGWDMLYVWDEPLMDPLGNPAPRGDHDQLVEAGQIMFDRMDPGMGAFFRQMNEGGFLDLKTRPTKAPGGFCETFPTVGMPVIFANFNGTHQDIGVFTHEMGHALQFFASRNLPSIDMLSPTIEACEIHSMALEMLTYPHIGLLVGQDVAQRFQRMHLETCLHLLVGCALGDHFQHEIYANPEACPAERHAIYRALEQRYMPWRNYGDLAHAAAGTTWQQVLHFYEVPFYYIDYALACCCAMQFWVKAKSDPQAALADYLALCARGGSASFSDLVASAGLVSPFSPGALDAVVQQAAAALEGKSI